jgi:type 1 glutamine amidotransferase
MSDPATRDMKGVIESDKDTGITWVKDCGKGRLFYCSLGHNNEIFMTPAILEHYLRGIQFAIGDFKVPTKPKGQQGAEYGANNRRQNQVKTYDFGDSRPAVDGDQ